MRRKNVVVVMVIMYCEQKCLVLLILSCSSVDSSIWVLAPPPVGDNILRHIETPYAGELTARDPGG